MKKKSKIFSCISQNLIVPLPSDGLCAPYSVRYIVGKIEALCFCLVLRNLRNFKNKQDGRATVRVYAWTVELYVFLFRFSQDL